MTEAIATGLLSTTVALAVPLILASAGELIVEKSGIINVGIEGMMLTGAFTGYVAAAATHSAMIGLGAAILSGVLMAALFGLMTLKFFANQVVIGTALNILALGLTGVVYRGVQASIPEFDPKFAFLPHSLPGLSRLPILGPSIFSQNGIAYFAFLIPIGCWWFLTKTRSGLALRAAGEYPEAADVSGFGIAKMRLLALLFGGGMAGLAGAYLSIAYTTGFAQGMSGGKGFIALAVVIVGRWSPAGMLLGSLLFGAASAAQFGFQASDTKIPYQLFLALPYLLTLLALVFGAGRTRAPAALGLPFKRG